MRPHLPLRAFVSSSRRLTTDDTGLQFRSESREMRLVSRLSGCSFYVTRRATARMWGQGIPLRVTTHRPSGLCCSVLESRMWGDRELPWGEEQFFVSMWTCSLESTSLCGGRWSWASKAPLPRKKSVGLQQLTDSMPLPEFWQCLNASVKGGKDV